MNHAVVVCDKVLAQYNRSGQPLYVLPLSAQVRVNDLAAGSGQQLFVRVAPTCERGADVFTTPSDLVSIVNEVKAKDGRPVALALSGWHAGTVP